MSIPLPSFLAENLHLEMPLALRWRQMSEGESVSCFTAQNILALQFIEAMPEHSNTVTEKIDSHHADLHRIEQRLDLLLGLVGQLLVQQTKPPPLRNVILATAGVCWQESAPASVGDVLLLELFLHMRTHPMCLAGTVTEVLHRDNHEFSVVRFAKLDLTLAELLEKWVFRQHRRAVARVRRPH